MKAISLIQASVHSNILPSISDFEDTPEELWTHLCQRYESRNTQQRFIFSHPLSSLELADDASLEKYLQQVDSITAQLSSISHRVPSTDIIHHTLKGLSANYGPFVQKFLG